MTQVHRATGTGELSGHRFILRKEKNGGMLVIDSMRILYLNDTAYHYTKLMLSGASPDEAVKEIQKIYPKVYPNIIKQDYNEIVQKIIKFVNEPDVYPIEAHNIESAEPFSNPPSAPLRLDLALTYRNNNKPIVTHLDSSRLNWDKSKELSTEQWKKIIDKAASAGIPNITFVGGEPTLREDLAELISYGEDLGIITGLVTNGRKLTPEKVDELIKAGIDYIQIEVYSNNEKVHDQMAGVSGAWAETINGLKAFIDTDIYTITNTTLTQINLPTIDDTVDFLADLGQQYLMINGVFYKDGIENAPEYAIPESQIDDIMLELIIRIKRKRMKLKWYTPIPMEVFDLVEWGLKPRICHAGFSALTVEPDGNVIPCQRYFEPIGNILTDTIDALWNSQLSKKLRGRIKKIGNLDKCIETRSCKNMTCPLYDQSGLLYCLDSRSGV